MVAVGSTCAAAWPRRRAATIAVMTFNGADREEGEALLQRGLRRARDPKARAFSLFALLFSGDDEGSGGRWALCGFVSVRRCGG
jgi:hypothetical protein